LCGHTRPGRLLWKDRGRTKQAGLVVPYAAYGGGVVVVVGKAVLFRKE
jgi:hypothetical protein